MRVVFVWESGGLDAPKVNPYGASLAKGFSKLGVEVVPGKRDDPWDESWLERNRGRLQVLHQHWPHYNYDVGKLEASVLRCANYISYLTKARSLGYKVVWTVHNAYPHESTNHALDRLARLALTNLATAVIVHCKTGADFVTQQLHRKEGLFRIPHGNFINVYPNTLSQSEARKRLRLADGKLVYLYFGNVRAYKGVDRLIDAFTKMPDENAVLIFVGSITRLSVRRKLKHWVSKILEFPFTLRSTSQMMTCNST
jgi:beta-1,4-mannosyltransferase